MTTNEYDWNDYGYDDDDYEQETSKEPKANNEVKQESSNNKYSEGIKGIFKEGNYNKGNKGPLKKKTYSNQPKGSYTNSNNYYKPKENKEQQNRDGKPIFFNNSKKGDIPLVNSANPHTTNTQYNYTSGNYNSVSNFNINSNDRDKEKNEFKAPQFKEREGQFVTLNSNDMRNNNKFYLSQDNIKSTNTEDTERPKFFGKINANNEQTEEKSNIVIKPKQVDEDLQMPVFLNSKKTESDSVPINEVKDLYTLKLSQHQSAPMKTKDANSKENYKKNKVNKDKNPISEFNQLNINETTEKPIDIQFEERPDTEDQNQQKDDKIAHQSDRQGKEKFKNNKRNSNNNYQKPSNYDEHKKDRVNYYDYDDFDRNYHYNNNKYNNNNYNSHNYESYENFNYNNNKKNLKSSVPIQHNEDYLFSVIIDNKNVDNNQKQRNTYTKEINDKPKIAKQTSNVSGNTGIVVEIPKGKSSLKELFK